MQEAALDFVAKPEKEKGLVVTELKPNGFAEKAGLLVNDVITQLGGKTITENPEALYTYLIGKWPGEEIDLSVVRAGETLAFKLALQWQHDVVSGPQDRNERMSGRISTRRSGFPSIIQHDIPLSSRTVGGPLLNLEGQCLGINIARYNRAETYAIPAEEIVSLLEEWKINK